MNSSSDTGQSNWLTTALAEAEERAANHPDPAVRERSQETVELCRERMRRESERA